METIKHIRVNENVYKQFKAAVALDGKTIKDVLNELMRDYIRRKNASRAKNSGVRWSYKRSSW